MAKVLIRNKQKHVKKLGFQTHRARSRCELRLTVRQCDVVIKSGLEPRSTLTIMEVQTRRGFADYGGYLGVARPEIIQYCSNAPASPYGNFSYRWASNPVEENLEQFSVKANAASGVEIKHVQT